MTNNNDGPVQGTTERDTKIVTRSLPCWLTDDERREFAAECAREVKDLSATQAEKKEVMAGFAHQIKVAEKDIYRLSDLVDTGVEWRPVDCRKQIDRYMGRVTVTRVDTGEVIENRAATNDELQSRMDI